MGAAMLLMANTPRDLAPQLAIILARLAFLLRTLFGLLLASWLQRPLGVTFMHFVNWVFGILLLLLATQLIFDGVAQSGPVVRCTGTFRREFERLSYPVGFNERVSREGQIYSNP